VTAVTAPVAAANAPPASRLIKEGEGGRAPQLGQQEQRVGRKPLQVVQVSSRMSPGHESKAEAISTRPEIRRDAR
jgi:hypothetical protein